MHRKCISLALLSTMHLTALYGLITTTDVYNHDFFSLSATSTWREYSHSSSQASFFKEKWAWASSLTLKSKRPVKLTTLTLHWNGPQIELLAAALYQKKERETTVVPIQKNLVCDGIWNPSSQKLTFKLDEKIIAVNRYHLLLSYPKEIESQLKYGKFLIADMQTMLIKKQSNSKN